MESGGSASEATPLLADPPIDDDIYHYEQRIFPSPLQKQLLLGKFTLSFMVSRLFEVVGALCFALKFNSSFVPITIYSVCVTLTGHPWSFIANKVITKKSRKVAIAYAIVSERLMIILICTLVLMVNESNYWAIITISTLLVLVQRSCDNVQVHVIEKDWSQVLANNESVPYAALMKLFSAIKTTCRAIAPILATYLCQVLGIDNLLQVMRALAFLSMLTEYTLVRKLYSTCYALRVPGLMHESDNKISFTRPSSERILFYIRKRPRPAIISIGMILTHTTLLTVRGQQFYYMYNKSVHMATVGVMSAATALKIKLPYALAIALNVLAAATALWALAFTHAFVFGISCVLSRVSLHSIEFTAKSYIHGLIADPESLILFSLIESRLAYLWSIAIIILPALWVTLDRFVWPVSISVALSLVGLISVGAGVFWGEPPEPVTPAP